MSQLGMVKMMLETSLNPGSLKANSRGLQISGLNHCCFRRIKKKKKNPANLPISAFSPLCPGCIVPHAGVQD